MKNKKIYIHPANYKWLLAILIAVKSFAFYKLSVVHFTDIMSPLYAKEEVKEAVKEAVKEEAKPEMNIQDKIVHYATLYGVNPDTALRVAKCESGLNPKAENVNGSATGLYQFIRKTWKNYCVGDVYNADHNIICFVQHFNDHPEWWEASKSCWSN
jgi:soluble lytic murein transglycosylase-like protein